MVDTRLHQETSRASEGEVNLAQVRFSQQSAHLHIHRPNTVPRNATPSRDARDVHFLTVFPPLTTGRFALTTMFVPLCGAVTMPQAV